MFRATNSPIFRSTFWLYIQLLVQCTDIAADRWQVWDVFYSSPSGFICNTNIHIHLVSVLCVGGGQSLAEWMECRFEIVHWTFSITRCMANTLSSDELHTTHKCTWPTQYIQRVQIQYHVNTSWRRIKIMKKLLHKSAPGLTPRFLYFLILKNYLLKEVWLIRLCSYLYS